MVQVPEGCSFLSSTQETVDGVIKGEYTYEDPIGSQITVTYQVNVDGSDYVERRKIIKGYGTDGNEWEDDNLLTADQVVEQVKTELRPVIIQIVRPAVLNSDVDLSNYDSLVETIMVQLNPVVTAGKMIITEIAYSCNVRAFMQDLFYNKFAKIHFSIFCSC